MVAVQTKIPSPLMEGCYHPFFGLPRQRQLLPLAHLYIYWRLFPTNACNSSTNSPAAAAEANLARIAGIEPLRGARWGMVEWREGAAPGRAAGVSAWRLRTCCAVAVGGW